MVEPLSCVTAPQPDSPADRQALKIVEVAHYVWGGILLLPFGLMFLCGLVMLPFHGMADERQTSGLELFLGVMSFSAPGALVGLTTLQTGRHIAKRDRRQWSVFWATCLILVGGAAAVAFAYRGIAFTRMGLPPRHTSSSWVLAGLGVTGAALGALTLVVLMRTTVKDLYTAHAPPTREGT